MGGGGVRCCLAETNNVPRFGGGIGRWLLQTRGDGKCVDGSTRLRENVPHYYVRNVPYSAAWAADHAMVTGYQQNHSCQLPSAERVNFTL
jgi:hypothetical protein